MINNLQERFGPEEEAFDSRRSSFALDPEQKAMHDLRNVLYGAVRAALKFAKELKDEKTVNRRMRMLYEKDDSLWRMEMEDREAWVADWKTKYEEVSSAGLIGLKEANDDSCNCRLQLLAASDAKEIAMQEELQTLLVQVSEMKQTMLRADAEQASQAKRMLDEMQSYRLRVQAAESQLRTLEQENTALKDQIDDMDNGTSALKNELLESNRRSEEAERRFHETVTAAERERKQLAARNQQLQDEIASLQHSLSNLRQQQEHRVQQYQEDVEGLAQQREQARLEALRLRTEAESLQQQILDLSHRHSRETSSISKENERLTAELAQTTGTIKDLRAAIASYETRVTTLVAANDNTARDLHQQAEKIEELEMAISRLQNLCDAQNQDIQSWEESANQLQTQLKSERQRQQAYASQVEDLKDQADKQHILLERVDTRIAGLLEMTGLDEVRGDDMLSRLGAVEGWVGEVQRGMVDAIHACRRKIRSIESNLQSQAGNLEDLENIARRANTKHQQLSELYNQTNFDLERTQVRRVACVVVCRQRLTLAPPEPCVFVQ